MDDLDELLVSKLIEKDEHDGRMNVRVQIQLVGRARWIALAVYWTIIVPVALAWLIGLLFWGRVVLEFIFHSK